jgi:hypothetical protein
MPLIKQTVCHSIKGPEIDRQDGVKVPFSVDDPEWNGQPATNCRCDMQTASFARTESCWNPRRLRNAAEIRPRINVGFEDNATINDRVTSI